MPCYYTFYVEINLSIYVNILRKNRLNWKRVAGCGLCLFMCPPITLKWLNSLTTIGVEFSCIGGLEVTHRIAVRQVPGSIPGPGKGFKCSLFCFVVAMFYFFVQNTLIVMTFCNFCWNVHSVYLTYCKLNFVTDYKGKLLGYIPSIFKI